MPGITRRAALASALAPAVLRGQRPAGDKPNLLFVWTDQQRADTMAAYGNAHFRVPAMNRLAEKSVVFDRYYVTQPVCTPSRSSILTGLWPHQSGTINNNVPLPATARCWPELLSDSAYRCGYFGKWHLGDEIFAQHGFHDWAGIEDGYIPHYSAARDRNARSAYHHFLLDHGYKPNTQQGTFSRGFACGLPAKHCKPSFLAARAEEFIERNRANPWLLSVNFLEPHSPYTGPYNDLHSSLEAPVPPNYPGPMEGREPRHLAARREATLNQRVEGQDLRQRAGWERLNRNYAGLCSQVDQALSRILWALETSGQAHNTVIVFTSDHGEMMGAHSLTGKGVTFEESLRVPLLIHVPFRGFRERRVRRPVSAIDLVPTVLDLLGRKRDEALPGESLTRVMNGEAPAEDHVFVEWNTDVRTPRYRGVVSPDGWKLTLHEDDHHTLFHRPSDPLELRNRYDTGGEAARVASALRKRIESWQRQVNDSYALPQ